MAGAPNWLHVETEDDSPQITTLSSCLTLSDVQRDGYVRLLAADISLDETSQEPSATLKVFRGLKLKQEQTLPGIPAAIASLYIDESEPKTPGRRGPPNIVLSDLGIFSFSDCRSHSRVRSLLPKPQALL